MGSEITWRWDLTQKTCSGIDEAFEYLQKKNSGLLVCSRRDGFLKISWQDRAYNIEVGMCDTPGDTHIYLRPVAPSLETIQELLSSFIRGDDFSFVRREWKYSRRHENKRPSSRVPKLIRRAIKIIGCIFVFTYLVYKLYELFNQSMQ